jgi:hypothetical protein
LLYLVGACGHATCGVTLSPLFLACCRIIEKKRNAAAASHLAWIGNKWLAEHAKHMRVGPVRA